MSSTREREYYRKYMRAYYQKHKDYWRNYYLQRKGSALKSGRSIRHRRDYFSRINAAWSKTHRETRLTKLFRRLGATATARFSSSSTNPPTQEEEEKRSINSDQLFKSTLLEILSSEGFMNVQIPTQNHGELLRQDFSALQALAMKDDDRCIVEVAFSPFKVFTKKRSEYLRLFLNFFNARYFLCFVKPDCSSYHLLELSSSRIKSVSLGLKAIGAMKPAPKIT
jgi:hypothetical protein